MKLDAKIRDALARDDGSEREVLRENGAEILAALAFAELAAVFFFCYRHQGNKALRAALGVYTAARNEQEGP